MVDRKVKTKKCHDSPSSMKLKLLMQMDVHESAEIPVCSSLGMVGGAELIDRLESESSSPDGTADTLVGGVTAESWT